MANRGVLPGGVLERGGALKKLRLLSPTAATLLLDDDARKGTKKTCDHPCPQPPPTTSSYDY